MIPTVTAIIEPGDSPTPPTSPPGTPWSPPPPNAEPTKTPTPESTSYRPPQHATRTRPSAPSCPPGCRPAYKPANTDIEATLELTPDSATIYALSLAIAATHRHEDTIDGALAADNLPGPQVMALFAENEAIHGRRKELKARQKAALTALLG